MCIIVTLIRIKNGGIGFDYSSIVQLLLKAVSHTISIASDTCVTRMEDALMLTFEAQLSDKFVDAYMKRHTHTDMSALLIT